MISKNIGKYAFFLRIAPIEFFLYLQDLGFSDIIFVINFQQKKKSYSSKMCIYKNSNMKKVKAMFWKIIKIENKSP